jgi:hypothetical protein
VVNVRYPDVEPGRTAPVAGSRRRWLVAAVPLAVLAVLVSGTLGVIRLAGLRAGGPNPIGGPVAPIGGPVAAGPVAAGPSGAGPDGAQPGAGSTGGATAGTGRPLPGGGAGRTVQVGPLALSLPAGWTADAPQRQAGTTRVCLVGRGGPAGCQLWVAALTSIPASGNLSVDGYGGLLGVEMEVCATGPAAGSGPAPTTTAYAVRTLGGRPAEYRAYAKTCGRPYRAEQWTVPTWPVVQISRPDLPPALVADVHAIVASAHFTEPDSGLRMTDEGLLAAHSTDRSGVVHIRLDRTVRVYGGADNGRDEDSNPTTYDYRLSPGVQVRDSGTLCADTTLPPPGRTCPLSTVLQRSEAGRTGIVHLDFDRSGVVVRINGEYRP